MKSQNVPALVYFLSEQILPFGFARQYRSRGGNARLLIFYNIIGYKYTLRTCLQGAFVIEANYSNTDLWIADR